jgi:two-component system CheB/CheR fusion protein
MAPRTEESEQRLRAGVESASPDEGPRDRRSEPNAYDEGRLLHELSVYQSELESQNEQLRQAQIELEESRTRYRDLYAEAPIAFLTVGIQGRILSCNRRAAELLRLTIQTAGRRRLTEFMSSDNAAIFTQQFAALYRSRDPVRIECELRRADGRTFWAEMTMNLSQDGVDGSPLCRVALTDLTDRKRIQDDTARLVAIVASSDQAIISQELDGRIATWNAGAERLFGYTAAQAIDHSIHLIVPPDRAGEEEEIRKRIRHRETIAIESVRVRQDGTYVSVFISAAPIFTQGRVSGVSYIIRDISEQVAARQDVARLLENLRQADRRKDDFIATLAHELRNPLAPIRNAAAVMRFVPDLTPKLQWCRDVIDRQVGHMAALLDDLLDVSRLSRDKITLRRDRLELGTAIAQAVELNRHLIEGRGHKLVMQLAPVAIEVEGDLTRLTQIFGNLLNNAVKYTDPGGEIVVTTEVTEGRVITRIRDNGIGIKPENLGKIFDLFAQVDPAREGTEGGLGIGLALVKGLVQRHGGTIVAASEGLSHGSEFTVSLPVARRQRMEITGDHPVVSAEQNARRLRVLVVDDNVDAAESMGMILSAFHEARTLHDGERALEIGGEFRPDVVVLDIGMPRMDGYQLAKHIRQAPWGRNIVLIACTGWGQPDDRRRSQEAGIDHHMVKPVSARAMLQLLSKIDPPESG